MKKLKKKNGFTLVEMLACIVTLLLIGLICSTGMNLAMLSLQATAFESNSQMLESTLDLYIGDILRHAIDVEERADKVTFTNEAYYIEDGSLGVDIASGEVQGAGYLVCKSRKDAPDSPGTMVANKGAYADNLYIKDFTLTYEEATGIFQGSYLIVSSVTEEVRSCEFSYRTITEMLE